MKDKRLVRGLLTCGLLFGIFFGFEKSAIAQDSAQNWGAMLVESYIHPFTTIATPIFLFLVTIFFIFNKFRHDIYDGVRSIAGTILPLIVVTFIYVFHKDLLLFAGNVNVLISFGVSVVWGIGIMVILRLCSPEGDFAAPISEIVLSGSFSLLVFSYMGANQVLSYYYGIISGFLIYIVFFGFPFKIHFFQKKTKASDKQPIKPLNLG